MIWLGRRRVNVRSGTTVRPSEPLLSEKPAPKVVDRAIGRPGERFEIAEEDRMMPRQGQRDHGGQPSDEASGLGGATPVWIGDDREHLHRGTTAARDAPAANPAGCLRSSSGFRFPPSRGTPCPGRGTAPARTPGRSPGGPCGRRTAPRGGTWRRPRLAAGRPC
jgi:hypothetical protein